MRSLLRTSNAEELSIPQAGGSQVIIAPDQHEEMEMSGSQSPLGPVALLVSAPYQQKCFLHCRRLAGFDGEWRCGYGLHNCGYAEQCRRDEWIHSGRYRSDNWCQRRMYRCCCCISRPASTPYLTVMSRYFQDEANKMMFFNILTGTTDTHNSWVETGLYSCVSIVMIIYTHQYKRMKNKMRQGKTVSWRGFYTLKIRLGSTAGRQPSVQTLSSFSPTLVWSDESNPVTDDDVLSWL